MLRWCGSKVSGFACAARKVASQQVSKSASRGSWFPTHSAKDAEWMGHPAIVGRYAGPAKSCFEFPNRTIISACLLLAIRGGDPLP